MGLELPIIGLNAEDTLWRQAIEDYRDHGNPSVTFKRLQSIFKDPNHCGMLGSLLVMKDMLLGEDGSNSYFQNLDSTRRTLVNALHDIYGNFAHREGKESVREIFHACKDLFISGLKSQCGCVDCDKTAAALESFRFPGRMPKLIPHQKKCAAEKNLLLLYNAALLQNKVVLSDEQMASLTLNGVHFASFDDSAHLSALASILYLCCCYKIIDHLQNSLIEFLDHQIKKIVTFDSDIQVTCPFNRAVDLIKSSAGARPGLKIPINLKNVKYVYKPTVTTPIGNITPPMGNISSVGVTPSVAFSCPSSRPKDDMDGRRGEDRIPHKLEGLTVPKNAFDSSFVAQGDTGPQPPVLPLQLFTEEGFENLDILVPGVDGLVLVDESDSEESSREDSASSSDSESAPSEDADSGTDEPPYLDLEEFEKLIYSDFELSDLNKTARRKKKRRTPASASISNPYYRKFV